MDNAERFEKGQRSSELFGDGFAHAFRGAGEALIHHPLVQIAMQQLEHNASVRSKVEMFNSSNDALRVSFHSRSFSFLFSFFFFFVLCETDSSGFNRFEHGEFRPCLNAILFFVLDYFYRHRTLLSGIFVV